MNRLVRATWLNLAAVAGIAAFAFYWWLRAPVLDSIGLDGWRAVALVIAGIIGSISVVLTRTGLPLAMAMAVGLIFGAAAAEFWRPDGFPVSLADSVVLAISMYRREFVSIIGATVAGRFLVQLALRRWSVTEHGNAAAGK